MSANNPLQKYFRQPKIYMALPSKGLFYPPGSLLGDYNNVPIFGMTGMDEIIMKTPDALFNGESTTKVIESCCPYISDASVIPSTDVDALLVGIRIATYGGEMELTHSCPACKSENEFVVDLQKILDYYSSVTFDGKIQIDELTITIRPLSYAEVTAFNMENFKLQKMLYQLSKAEAAEDETKTQEVNDSIYKRISEMQVELFLISIDNIQVNGEIVTDGDTIAEWLQNSDRKFFKAIKQKLESNKEMWNMPKQHVTCSNCQHEADVEVTLDQANFFAKS
jgi:hypothetical protein